MCNNSITASTSHARCSSLPNGNIVIMASQQHPLESACKANASESKRRCKTSLKNQLLTYKSSCHPGHTCISTQPM